MNLSLFFAVLRDQLHKTREIILASTLVNIFDLERFGITCQTDYVV